MSFQKTIEQDDANHNESIRKIVQEKSQYLESAIYGFTDPASALKTLGDYFATQIQLEQEKIPLTLIPEQQLEVIKRVENWYSTRGLKHPNPEWAEEQKKFWKNK